MTAPTFGTATAVPRTYGRPNIIKREHAPNADMAAALAKYANKRTAAEKRLIDGAYTTYTRCSTLAKALDSGDSLAKWKAAMTLIGAAKSPAIVKAARVLTDWHDAGELVDKSLTLAGAGDKATEGTTLHKLTEIIDTPGRSLPDGLDVDTLASLFAYEQATAGLVTVAAETFVVCDDIEVAGTFDRLYRIPPADPWPEWLHDRTVVGDLKTGSIYPGPIAIQLATYAHGELYDTADGTRTPLGADQTLGLLMHLPLGGARCDIYAVNLVEGWRGARLAKDVHSWGRAGVQNELQFKVVEIGAA